MDEQGCTLVVLTERYPYATGEEFFEQELRYLSERFEQVVVVPRVAGGPLRPVPGNVEVVDGLAGTRPSLSAALLAIPDAVLEFMRNARYTLTPTGLRRLLWMTWGGLKVLTWLRARRPGARPELLYSYWSMQAAVGCALYATRTGTPFVTRTHGWDLYMERHSPPYLPYRRLILDRAHRIFAISDHGRDYLLGRAASRGAERKVEVARLGVRRAQAVPDAPPESTPLLILSCSSITPVKRLDTLVDGLALFCKQHRGLRVEWIHFGDGLLREDIEARARQELSDLCGYRFMGHRPNDDVLRFMAERAVDAFVNTSESEGVPVTIMEALSHGVPVVAPRVGGIPELVTEENGFLMPAVARPEDVATGLERLVAHRTSPQRREAALERWQAMSDADTNFARFARELSGLVPEASYVISPGEQRAV